MIYQLQYYQYQVVPGTRYSTTTMIVVYCTKFGYVQRVVAMFPFVKTYEVYTSSTYMDLVSASIRYLV